VAPGDVRPPAVERTTWPLLVGQLVLLGLVVLLPHRADWTVPDGVARVGQVVAWAGLLVLVVAAVELGRGLTAAPRPNAHAQLRTSGLFGLVRHPIYAGLMLFAISRALTSENVWSAVACCLLIVLLNIKARWEERLLVAQFPGYAAYASRTPRFIPWSRRT
jgi:protein-S-isoprenylcysteine O-methyltransferase Ste14